MDIYHNRTTTAATTTNGTLKQRDVDNRRREIKKGTLYVQNESTCLTL